MQNVLYFVLIGLLVSACGSSSDNDDNNESDITSSPTALTGTAAIGAPVPATITIKAADGSIVNTTSGPQGKYAIDMGSKPGPYFIKIEPTNANIPTIYSYSPGAGIANGTQFTTLALFIAKDTDLAEAFNNWQNIASDWTLADIEKSMAIINANLATQLADASVDPNTFDMFTYEFAANGEGIDGFLDKHTVEIDYVNTHYTVKDTTGSNLTIDESVDTSDYYIGALFDIDASTQWVVSMSLTLDGETSVQQLQRFPIPAETVPYSRSRFMEEGWGRIGETSQVVDTGQGSIRYTVLSYTPTYTIQGNGDVGTKITAGIGYQYNIKGSIEGRNIDQTYSYSWSMEYERINS